MNVVKIWNLVSKFPLGTTIFSKLVGLWIPYTGSIRACVLELGPRRVRIQLKDRRRVRNHLRSIHAIALANLGEYSTGLALTAALTPGSRIIIKQLQIEYLKKARGTLVSQVEINPQELPNSGESWVRAEIRDLANNIVCRTQALWKIDGEPA
jgi:acyl-coenzyme A thioesterase PaaI-like protein